jgi:hypothetical protein
MQERIISVYFGLPSDTDPEAATMALPGFDAIV